MFADAASLVNGNYSDSTDLLPSRASSAHASAMPELPVAARHDPKTAATASPWLDAYIDFSRIWSPRAHDDFHESVGLWMLSTVAARRIAVDFGKRRYTSLYIALASRTSVFAKSTTADIAQAILKAAGLSTMMAPDDATPQAFVRAMTYQIAPGWIDLSMEQQEARRQKLAFAAQKGWYFDEFGQKVSSMMREGGFMADFRGLLRKFDDTPDTYEYDTIGRGTDVVYSPYLSLLANLTPADLKPYAKRGAALWNDGFWARFAFLTPPLGADRKNERFPHQQRVIPPALVKPIADWHRRLGIPDVQIVERNTKFDALVTPPEPQLMILTDSVYDAYYRYNDALIDIVTKSNLTDLDGNYARLPEKALRVAMILASLAGGNTVEMRHWHRAQAIAETWRRNLHNLYDQVVGEEETTKAVAMEDKICRLIADKGPRTVREIVQGVRGLDSGQAKTLVKTMVDTGFLTTIKDGRADRYCLAIDPQSVDSVDRRSRQNGDVGGFYPESVDSVDVDK